jgi:hypothetical protein
VGDLEIQQHTRLVARGKYVHAFEGIASYIFTLSPNSQSLTLQYIEFSRAKAGSTRKPRALASAVVPSDANYALSLPASEKFYTGLAADSDLKVKLTGGWEVAIGELDTFGASPCGL